MPPAERQRFAYAYVRLHDPTDEQVSHTLNRAAAAGFALHTLTERTSRGRGDVPIAVVGLCFEIPEAEFAAAAKALSTDS